MLRILVGPNGCGKSDYLNKLAGYNTHINTTSGLEKLNEVAIIIDYATETKASVYIDNVDAFIDSNNLEKLCGALVEASKHIDVWVSTHNGALLNWLDKDQAIESVQLVKDGNIYPYFIEGALEKLKIITPSEVFCDTDLDDWWGQI